MMPQPISSLSVTTASTSENDTYHMNMIQTPPGPSRRQETSHAEGLAKRIIAFYCERRVARSGTSSLCSNRTGKSDAASRPPESIIENTSRGQASADVSCLSKAVWGRWPRERGAVSKALHAFSNWMHKPWESLDTCHCSLPATALRSGSPGYWLLVRGQLRTSERGVNGKSKIDWVVGLNLGA